MQATRRQKREREQPRRIAFMRPNKFDQERARMWKSTNRKKKKTGPKIDTPARARAEDKKLGVLARRALKEVRARSKIPLTRSERMKKLWADPDFRARQIVSRKKAWDRPGYREKQSKIIKERWNKPGYRERHSKMVTELWADPEYRAKAIEGMKKPWEDPIYKAEMTEMFNELRRERALVLNRTV